MVLHISLSEEDSNQTINVPQSLADLGPIKALPDEELGSLLASFFNTEEWLPKEAFRALLTKCLDLYLGSLDLGLERLFSRKNFLLILTLEFNRKILRFLAWGDLRPLLYFLLVGLVAALFSSNTVANVGINGCIFHLTTRRYNQIEN